MAVVSTRLGPVVVHDRPSSPPPRNRPVNFDPNRLRGFTVHYSGGPLARRYPATRSVVESDRQVVVESIVNHLARVDEDGKPTMADVGYNLIVGRSGEVWFGRGLAAMNGANGNLNTLGPAAADRVRARLQAPASLETTNGYYQSVLMIVGTDPGYDDLSPAQLVTVPRLLVWLADHYRLARPEINGHRDVRATLCPGPGAYARLAGWQQLFTPTPIQPTPTPEPKPAPPDEEDDMQIEILAPRGCAARFLAMTTRTGIALQCEWTGPGSDPRVQERIAAHRSVGARERVIDVAGLRNVTLIGPVPTGDPGRKWSPADFARVVA